MKRILRKHNHNCAKTLTFSNRKTHQELGCSLPQSTSLRKASSHTKDRWSLPHFCEILMYKSQQRRNVITMHAELHTLDNTIATAERKTSSTERAYELTWQGSPLVFLSTSRGNVSRTPTGTRSWECLVNLKSIWVERTNLFRIVA